MERSEIEAQRRSGEEAPAEAREFEQAHPEDEGGPSEVRREVGLELPRAAEGFGQHALPGWGRGAGLEDRHFHLGQREVHESQPRSRSAEVEGHREAAQVPDRDSPRTQRLYERLMEQQERMAHAIYNLQRQSPMYSAPGTDASEAMERVAEALAKIRPQVEVPGNPGAYEGGQDFHTWKRYVLRCQTTNRWTARELRDRMGQFLAGPAWTTFERLRDAGDLPTEAAAILDAVGSAHCDVRGAERAAEAKFLHRKQRAGESIYDFIKVFEALAADCRADDAFKIRTFLGNVQAEAREALTRRDARTWTELRAAAMIEQQVLDSRAQAARGEPRSTVGQVSWHEEDEASKVSRVAAVPGQQQWYQAESRFRGLQGSGEAGRIQGRGAQQQLPLARGRAEGSEQSPAAELSLEEKLDRLTELVLAVTQASMPQTGRRCFKCGKVGHIARDCQAAGNEGGAGGAVGPRAPPK